MSSIVESTWFFFLQRVFFLMKPNVLCSHWTRTLTVEYWLSNPYPSENTGWRCYIFIFSPFNQLDKYWPILALKCSNLYFGGYAVVFGKQDDRVSPKDRARVGEGGLCGSWVAVQGTFSIDDCDGSKTSLLNWIGFFFFKLCHVYSSSLKMSNVGKFPWTQV